MKIDVENTRYYTGLGDLITLAWLAEGSRLGPDPIVFHRRRNRELLEMFQMTIDDEPGGISLDSVYRAELDDGGLRPRLEYLTRFLGTTMPPLRPHCELSDHWHEWAEAQSKSLRRPLVLLFPQTAWMPREWPASYWVDLAWALNRQGLGTIVILGNEDERFKNTPRFAWGWPLQGVAALIQRAALVVGNDSFPAHLAGTLGVPTLALMGPTRRTVFSHIPDVECFGSTRIDCTGCHFRPPFRAACDQGCMSLYRLFPEDVLERVQAKLRLGSSATRL